MHEVARAAVGIPIGRFRRRVVMILSVAVIMIMIWIVDSAVASRRGSVQAVGVVRLALGRCSSLVWRGHGAFSDLTHAMALNRCRVQTRLQVNVRQGLHSNVRTLLEHLF